MHVTGRKENLWNFWKFMEGKRIKSKLDTVFTAVIKKFNRLVQTWNKYLEEKT